MTLALPGKLPFTKTWRLDTSLLTDLNNVTQTRLYIQNYFWENNTSDIFPLVQWSAHKCVLRGTLIAMAMTRKCDTQASLNPLMTRLWSLETNNKQSQAQQTYQELIQVWSMLLDKLGRKVKCKFIRKSQKLFYECGNKSGKFLARALQAKKAVNTIHHLRSPQGQTLTASTDIATQFECFYPELYNLPGAPRPVTELNPHQGAKPEFLNLYCPKPITQTTAHEIDKPLTLEEFKLSVKKLKAGKSPGPDGFTTTYYKTFQDNLASPFLLAFNTILPSNPAAPDLLEADITVVPKVGKDPTSVTNYWTISLLNVDLKIFAKILANRLLPLFHSLIAKDQVGFILGREARVNTTKDLNLHYWLTTSKKQGFFLSLDAEKAFDRLDWDYMTAVLCKIGTRDCLLYLIMSLYAKPSARVNGLVSNAFPIYNGTRQGHPLLPLLFVLTLEPFLCCLRTNNDI